MGAQKTLFFLMKKIGALKKKMPEGHTLGTTKNSIKSPFYAKKLQKNAPVEKRYFKKNNKKIKKKRRKKRKKRTKKTHFF